MPSPDDLSLAQRVVEQGVCQQAEVDECLAIQRKSEQSGKLEVLGELLVQRGFLTPSQLNRLLLHGKAVPSPSVPSTLRLGPYELLLKLGEGGMGAVYKANDTRNGKIVAIKVLPRSKAKDELFLKRFEMEARATFELDHPNIVHGYDIGHSDGYHYLVIEFVQGYDLCALLEQRGRFTETEALGILEQMAKALDHIHTEHLVHRDIKPENILVGEDGVAKLTDMGLTVDDPAHGRRRRLTQAGIAMGTPFYLSPEQIKGESDVDIRSDIYALGATTYEMVTGRPPFEGETPAVVMLKHLNEYVPSPHDLDRTISINFCHLLERMMAKDPFHRYQTPYELLQDVRRVIRGKQPMGIRPPSGRSSVARPELHQKSQRLDPVEGRMRTRKDPSSHKESAPDTINDRSEKDSAQKSQSSDNLQTNSKSNISTAPSSNLLPALGPNSPLPQKLTLSRPKPAQSGSKVPVPEAKAGGLEMQTPLSDSVDTETLQRLRTSAHNRIKTEESIAKPRSATAPQSSGVRPLPQRKSAPAPKKASMPMWLWSVMLIIVILCGAFALYQYVNDDKSTQHTPPDSQQAKPLPAETNADAK